MTWQRAPVAAALVQLLEPLDATVTVFGAPPLTFAPPALIVWYPTLVQYSGFAYQVDLVTLPIMCAAGLGEWDRVDELAAMVRGAVDTADPQLGGSVAVARAYQQSETRIVSVAGADVLAANVILEIRK